MFCTFLMFPVLLTVGPSEWFAFPDKIWLMVIGQIVNGIVDPFLLIHPLPEMVDSVIPHYPESIGQVNDISAGLFNMFLGIGQIIGPLYGAIMTKNFGFRICCDTLGLFCLIFSIIYFNCA